MARRPGGDALELGLQVGLGADWLPSGSTSLLDELRVARRCLADRGTSPPPRSWSHGHLRSGEIAGLEDRLGRLEEGRPADLVVFERREDHP